MSGALAYEREPYRRELEVRVLRVGEQEGRPWAVLDDTICYPEGGGQPADHGRLGSVAVVDVQRRDGDLLHFVERAPELGPARLTLDWERRYDHMQQHTAQHLLSALAIDRFGWLTRSFHLGVESADIELDTPPPSDREVAALEEAAVAEVRRARPVCTRWVTSAEYAKLEVRSRGLPAGHTGDVRLVEIEGVDLNTCGGTHVANLAEIETIELLRVEPLRGGSRWHWLAGSRVRRRLAQHEARNAALRGLLGGGDEELVGLAGQKLEQLAVLRRAARHNEERLALLEAESLGRALGARGGAAEAHFAEADAAFLQRVARRFAERYPRGVLLVTGGGAGAGSFALAGGGESGVDLAALGAQVAALLDGRGGGRPPVFQGKAESLARRDEAVRLVRATQGGDG
jgi:alanyl-tRNA synthetase